MVTSIRDEDDYGEDSAEGGLESDREPPGEEVEPIESPVDPGELHRGVDSRAREDRPPAEEPEREPERRTDRDRLGEGRRDDDEVDGERRHDRRDAEAELEPEPDGVHPTPIALEPVLVHLSMHRRVRQTSWSELEDDPEAGRGGKRREPGVRRE